MESVLIGLFVFSLVLFFISFFLKDPYKDIREEIDQLSMHQLQELYQIKKKLKVLEEELLISDIELSPPSPQMNLNKKAIHEIIKNQVWSLAKQGAPIEQIAKQSSLSVQEVQSILKESTFRGKKYD